MNAISLRDQTGEITTIARVSMVEGNVRKPLRRWQASLRLGEQYVPADGVVETCPRENFILKNEVLRFAS